jgi:hypothetical protein
MLALPGTGFRRSVNVHNSDLMTACDWVEGTILFQKEVVSTTDVQDYLEEQYIYDSDGEVRAIEYAEMIWSELRIRAGWLGQNAPFVVETHTVRRTHRWRVAVGHAFCLLLTFAQQDAPGIPTDGYVLTGDLFERFSEECLKLHGWATLRTGWASGLHTPAFRTIVTRVAHELREPVGPDDVVALFEQANEEGLDLVCYSPFPDQRCGIRVYLMQCASGRNWKSKLNTPNPDVWRMLVMFSAIPSRGFCAPIALDGASFSVSARRANGLLIDRYRLLHGGAGLGRNLSPDLRKELVTWAEPKIADLLDAAK